MLRQGGRALQQRFYKRRCEARGPCDACNDGHNNSYDNASDDGRKDAGDSDPRP